MRAMFYFVLLAAGLLQSVAAVSKENLVKLTPEQAQHIGIRTLKPEMTRREPLVRAPARVALPPYNEYVVSAPQPGFVTKVDVALGVRVSKGQVLAIIRSPELIGLQRAVVDASTGLNLAEAKLHRDKTLLAEGIIASIRYRETKSDYDRAATALMEAEQLLTAAGFGAGEIRELIKDRRLGGELPVRSPVDGVVLERLAVTGQRVDLLAPLFRVGKLGELWLEIDMPMERLSEVRLGDSVEIETVDASARIVQVSQSVNPSSQSALVRAVIKDRADLLKPGQNVNVRLMHASSDQLFHLPAEAVFSQDGKDYVFVRVADGYEARRVAVASREERNVLIHEGLTAGDEVVIQGVASLKASWLGIGSNE